jgi:hypothetical protein
MQIGAGFFYMLSTEARYLDRGHMLTHITDLLYFRPESITEDESNEIGVIRKEKNQDINDCPFSFQVPTLLSLSMPPAYNLQWGFVRSLNFNLSKSESHAVWLLSH